MSKENKKKLNAKWLKKQGKSLTGNKFIYLYLSTILASLCTIAVAFSASMLFITLVFSVEKSIVLNYLNATAIFIAFRFLLHAISDKISKSMAEDVHKNFSNKILDGFFSLPNAGQGFSSATLSMHYVEDMKNIQTFFSSYIPSSMAMSISVVVFFITFMVLSPIVALVFLLATILSVVSAIIMGKKAKKIQHKQSSNISKLSNYFFTILQGIHIVKYYGSQKNLHAIGASLGEEYRKTTMSLLKVVFISAGIIAMLGGAVIGVAFNAISYNQNSDYFNYGLAIFMLLMAGESFALLRSLLESFHAKSKAVTSIERIGATFGDKVFSLEDNIIASKEEDLSFLEFNNVSFSYNNKNEVINNLNWKINAGEYWVVRGESGCGKSTIIDMLLGFISPTKGEITINGNQLKKDERNQILQISSLVEQQANLFYGSIKENLLLANQSATMEKIEEVCKNLHLHEWIESLPNKYEEVISSNSRNISGGQAHRMSLARALLAKPQILVLDEYSAHLDHKTYTDIQKYIYDLHKKESISIIEISHNLNEEINYENIKILDISQDGIKVV